MNKLLSERWLEGLRVPRWGVCVCVCVCVCVSISWEGMIGSSGKREVFQREEDIPIRTYVFTDCDRGQTAWFL